MAEGEERSTGTPNTIYDLSSVLFHALEGGASYDTYIEDAEREGDRELGEFFRQVRDEDSERADRAQELLAERTSTAARTGGAATPMEGVASDTPLGTEPIGTTPGGGEALPPRAEDVPPRTGEAPPMTEERPLGEDVPPRAGEAPPMTEERPLGTEGTMPPRPEEAPPRTERIPPPRTEEVSPRAEEAPLPEEQERARREERDQEDKGLIDRARDALRGE